MMELSNLRLFFFFKKCIFPHLILDAANQHLQPQPPSNSTALQASSELEELVGAVFPRRVLPTLIIRRQTTVIIQTIKYNLLLLWLHHVQSVQMCM